MGKCSKDKRDIFYRLAKEEGWRARSAFKLLQIEEQFKIFDGVSRAVDLCAAPGSWSQVLAKKLRRSPKVEHDQCSTQNNDPVDDVKIVAVDIQTMAPIEGVTPIQGDITSFDTANRVIREFEGDKAQLVVCDGAPDVTGQHDLDEFMQSQLLLAALNLTSFIIEDDGTFVAKIFRGRDITLMIAQFSLFFQKVQVIKPKSSRTSSIEAFIVCRKFSLPLNYKPRMFNLLTDFEKNKEQQTSMESSDSDIAGCIIPFLKCGDLNQLEH